MSTKVQSMIKLMLVFVVSLLSFSVGTYVGFKFSENKHKLAILEPKAQGQEVAGEHDSENNASHSTGDAGHSQGAGREIASVKDPHSELSGDHSVGNNEIMSDDEIAKLAEEFVKDDESPKEKIQEPKKSPASVTAPQKSHDSPSHAVLHPPEKPHATEMPQPKKNQVETSVTPQNPQRIPKSLPPTQAYESAGKFTVQVSSFAAEPEAKQKALDLKNKGYNAFYVPTDIKGKTWFRVSIGIFQNEKEAKGLRENYLKEYPDSSAFIQRVPIE